MGEGDGGEGVIALQCTHHNGITTNIPSATREQFEPLLLRRSRSSDRHRSIRDEPPHSLPDSLPPTPGRAPLPPASQSPPEPCGLPQDRRVPLTRARMTHNRVSGAFTWDFATLASIPAPIPPPSASLALKSAPFVPRNTSFVPRSETFRPRSRTFRARSGIFLACSASFRPGSETFPLWSGTFGPGCETFRPRSE